MTQPLTNVPYSADDLWITRPFMKATIFVVEDDAATGEFLLDLLDMEGYNARVAPSGQAALAALREQPVDMVLLDRRLPDMDGLDVCRAIRASINTTLPVILLTADYSLELDTAAQQAGITAYLPKPFMPQVLLDRVAALLHK